jgi:ABC-type transport system involved in multi-copper enzyme maturation permease subunit
MIRVIRAELLRLLRRRTITGIAAGCALFSAVATLAVFSTAQATGIASRQTGTTLAALAGDGGGTEAFAVGASFVGFLVFVTFIALLASEFSGGTLRAFLVRNPNRQRVIIGKLTGILIVAALALAIAETCTFAFSLAVAPVKDVSTADWFSLESCVAALRDYATVLGGVAGWAFFGTALAVIFRSVPLALGVGFAWAGPIENIAVQSWQTGYSVFPGQVLASLIQGGTAELGIGRAALTAALYTAVAAAFSLALLSRRDVTT